MQVNWHGKKLFCGRTLCATVRGRTLYMHSSCPQAAIQAVAAKASRYFELTKETKHETGS